MNNVAIGVDNLSKLYRIGLRERYKTLRHTLTDAMYAPFRAVVSTVPGHQSVVSEEPSNNFIWALKDVSFEVKPGEVVGIIGRNGAGKSTLLKILSRITEPTEGRAEIHGRVGSLLEVGTGFHPELTGRENIYLNGAILGMKRTEIERKFDEIVAFAEVEKFIDTPVKHYSSGMYIRLAFAVAAYLEPEILLVDEVLAVGDAAFQKKCLGKMSDVARAGRTVLFVSHNTTAITSLCQRAIWLEQGRLQQDSTADSSVSSYLASLRCRQTLIQDRVLLDDHPGRRKGTKYDGIILMCECQLVNENEQPTSHLKSGREARVRIGYRMKFEVTDAAITFVCAFRSSQGQRIAYCSSDVVGSDLGNLPINGVVECLIPKLPFFPGTYSIDIGCKIAGDWTDFIYDAVEFEVIGGGFYTTGLLPPDGGGNCLVEYSWNAL